MPENTTPSPDPLRTVVAMEAAAFRTGQIARQLVADHPNLPLDGIEPTVATYDDLRGIVVRARLELQLSSAQVAQDWAAALGCEHTVTEHETGYGPSTVAKFETVIDGVTIQGRGATTDVAEYVRRVTQPGTETTARKGGQPA